ncbi:UNVERIFIED_CONTAM: hypothetical protein N8J90_00910 [Halobacillus marinus]|uniref:hypothetical protein n=1 Tax=Bacillaceae TaxID=186817 RepID=UPI00047B537F|nr:MULTISPECIES: hypothetical protein [Bacillaceae]QHT46328.1 hypothetical protein M662_07410 [Bacillus sp. SB49]
MFKKIMKGISKEFSKRGSSSGRRRSYRHGSSSGKRRKYYGSSSSRRGRNPLYGSHRYKKKRHYSSS